MPFSIYQVTVPIFIRGLERLSVFLDKAEGFAAEKGIDANDFVHARLAPDMLPLSGQVQRASDTSKLAVARLGAIEAPRFEDIEKTFPELGTRIADTIAFLRSVEPGQLDGAEGKTINFKAGPNELSFRGDTYVTGFALPNFFFHVTTAYDILRHAGVPLGKRDFLGEIS
jgi:hypothetical protein